MATSSDKEFLEFVIKSLVDNPEAVKVNRTVDEMGVLLTLVVDRKDMPRIIGRHGSTAQAIRSLTRLVGLRNNARVNLKIEEPEGGSLTQDEKQSHRSASDEAEKAIEDLNI